MISHLFRKSKIETESEINGKQNIVMRTGKTTEQDVNNFIYKKGQSFVDYLPYVEFQEESQTLLLEDGISVGAIYEITPFGTEGRPLSQLIEIRDIAMNALQDSLPERDNNPWVIQFYCNDEDDLTTQFKSLKEYISPIAKKSQFTEAWLKVMEKHYRGITKPEGLFMDDIVTKTAWRGQNRITRMVIYRYVSKKELPTMEISPEEELNNLCERIIAALKGGGLYANRLNRQACEIWLTKWFNPEPEVGKHMFYDFLNNNKENIENNELPIFNDFSESLFYSTPVSKNNYWYFDNKPHSVVVVDRLRKPPKVGHLTAENQKADAVNALFDFMPESTVMCLTIIVQPQDKLEQHLDKIASKALGENTESIYTKQDCNTVKQYFKDGYKMYRSSLVFYISGNDIKDLKKRIRNINSSLLNAGLVPVNDGDEIAPLSSYLRWLPMCFDPERDRRNLYTKLNFVQHISNLLPIFGRSVGTGHPGISYFNRGGGILTYDPFIDKAQNGHMLILGPTGAGKSATLNLKIAQLMAVHRPRLVIVEAGNSFGLMTDYAEKNGLTVHRVSLKPGSGVVLPLFADAHKILEKNDIERDIDNFESKKDDLEKIIAAIQDPELEKIKDVISQKDDDAEERDILGEMEIAARLMITGGEAKEDEKMTRADRSMIREAIINAARNCFQEGRQTITQDVRDALYKKAKSDVPEETKTRAFDMATAMEIFCKGFEGELFNKVVADSTVWPDADIIHVDLAHFAREGYEAHLAISYISLINHINNLGEKYQHEARPIVNITDEAHIITVNTLLAAFLTKGSKMWRKLGIWLWLATQNMADFPNAAKKLLSMIEWWELLVTPASEAEEISRFRALTTEQSNMITSATKAKNKYTEGVVLSKNVEALFRVVPPSLYLALAMTEKDEKAERMELMQKHEISELDAAFMVAEKLDRLRGINV